NGDEFEFQVGPNDGEENTIKFKLDANTTGSAVGITGLDVTDRSSALSSLGDLDEAIKKVAGARAMFGAAQSRFYHTIDTLAVQQENVQVAVSNIEDVNVAEETSKLAAGQIQQQAGVAVMAQANATADRVIRLIN